VQFTLWFTGLPGSGKTTLATELYRVLKAKGLAVELFDSDIVGAALGDVVPPDAAGRDILARSMALGCTYLNRNGVICLAAATTPRAQIRDRNRRLIRRYHEVFCNCPLAEAEKRDPKGLYAQARAGWIKSFTGVTELYETPMAPELVLNTHEETATESLMRILSYLSDANLIPADGDGT
jgi:adenylylsulfate kinase